MLTEQEERLVHHAQVRCHPAMIVGGLLIMAAFGYGLWAVRQLDPKSAAPSERTFDRPIARIVEMVAVPPAWVASIDPKTELEGELLKHVVWLQDLLARFIGLSIRILVCSMVCTMGGLLMAIGGTQKLLLNIIAKLRQN